MADLEVAYTRLLEAIDGNNPHTIATVLEEAKNAFFHAFNNEDPYARELLALIIDAQTQMIADEEEDTDTPHHIYPPTDDFDKAVSEHFTEQEKRYYESIDPKAQYALLPRASDGRFIPNPQAAATADHISGAEIRHAFAVTKYFALSEYECETITFYRGADQLDELRESVEVLVARRAYVFYTEGRDDKVEEISVAREMVLVHIDAVRQVTQSYNPARQATAPIMRQRLQQILQQDILDDALGLRKTQAFDGTDLSATPERATYHTQH